MPQFNGMVGQFIPNYSTILPTRTFNGVAGAIQSSSNPRRGNVSSPIKEGALRSSLVTALPPFIPILNTLLRNTRSTQDSHHSKNFISNVGILHDVAFSPKCPILGTGHHFAVFAAPFDPKDRGFIPVDGRAINGEVYCLKNPNFTSNGAAASPATKTAFRTEYYNTALQEIRVLLHPRLRHCENVINLFGIDFQEDYDDYTVAWPVLLMEYAEHGTLATLQEDITTDNELARILLLDIALGLRALHECNIIHGDVKSENVLICRHTHRRYIAKLADFGLSVINPDAEGKRHRLPGGTFLWSAPEIGSALSVEGLRQTDVYSFGLTAWRVLANHPNPFVLIPPATLGTPAPGTVNEAVTLAKSRDDLDILALHTMGHSGTYVYSRQLIEAALSKDPTRRSLGVAISALSRGQETVLSSSEPDETYWAMEEPSLVLEELESVWTDMLPTFIFKPSVMHSLASGLESLFSGTSTLSGQAGWMLFQFASSPQFRLLGKDINQICQMLVRLCEQGVASAQAIVFRYHDLHGKSFQSLHPTWLEVAAAEGSYYALKSLRGKYPEKYLELMHSGFTIEPDLSDLDDQAALLRCCRLGDYAGCKALLSDGVSAFPAEEGMVSPLHWLVSFKDAHQINDLLEHLIANGAVVDACEGSEGDFTFGRLTGTPLHWAVWHRNIPVLRALIKVDDDPNLSDLNRGLFIAAGMHFYDMLEILKTWALGLQNAERERYEWRTALLCVAENTTWQLPRRLRHGYANLPTTFERTMDSILTIYEPSEEDIKILFKAAVAQNHGLLFQYLFSRFNLGKRIDLLNNPDFDPVAISIGGGFRDIFELCIENGLLTPESGHGTQGWKALQVFCFIRQRDPTFARRLLEIGCRVDDVSDNDQAKWTPFAIAVSVGLYHIAIMLLEHGANKDHLLGWLGGQTVTMNLLQNWPDIPISRLKFLLEEIPRLGFGHVTFWGWPGGGGNLLYALSMNHWSSYTAGYRLGESAKYILSQLADKSCLNKIDKLGATALRMACANGNLEICRALIEAGQDVNLALGYSPLRNAREWMDACCKREKVAMQNRKCPGSERRLAKTLRERAEEVVQLMVNNGAVNRGHLESMQNTQAYIASGQWQKPSLATALEMFSGVLDKSPRVEAGSTPLQPTSASQFKAHHGVRSPIQVMLANWGLKMDNANGQTTQRPPARWDQHNCLPWRNDHCNSCPSGVYKNNVPPTALPISHTQSQRVVPHQPSPANALGGQPSHFDASTSFYEDLYNASFVRPKIQRQSDSNNTLNPVDIEAIENRIRDNLLVPFLDGGDAATEREKRKLALSTLKEQLQEPINLAVPGYDITSCEEFARINSLAERCFEVMSISGIYFVPELIDNGRELLVHVCEG